jgi:superfamily II DNA helicase RecQ
MFHTIAEIADAYGVSSKAIGKALYTLGIRDPDHPLKKGFPKEQYILHGIAKPVYTPHGELRYFTYDVTTVRAELETLIKVSKQSAQKACTTASGIYEQVCEIEALLYDVNALSPELTAALQTKVTRLKSQLLDDDITLALPLDEASHTLYEMLRDWRNQLARGLNKPAYTIFGNKVLHAIAYHQPEDHDELLAIKGVGDKKAERYGSSVLALIRGYA